MYGKYWACVYGLSESYDEAGYGEQSTDILVIHRKLELMLSKVKSVSSYISQYTSVIKFLLQLSK